MVLGSSSHCQACDDILHLFPGAEVWYPPLLVVKIHVEGSGIESHNYRTQQDNDLLESCFSLRCIHTLQIRKLWPMTSLGEDQESLIFSFESTGE